MQFCWIVIAEPLNSAGRERGRVKIATAAEPECGEGERRKFDEIFAEVDESAILELCETAGFARHEEDFEAARIARKFVAAEGAREIGGTLGRGGQGDGGFDGGA